MTPSLSAILIAKNEAEDLPGCLEALKSLADQIVVVVANDSTDETEAIARAHGALVIKRSFDNYAGQRQASLEAAKSEWCLWIDPDERISSMLAAEIKETLSRSGQCAAYEIPFEVNFLGKTLRWGGLGHERHLRLFRTRAARFKGGELHEGIEVEGSVARLHNAITHRPYKDLSDYMGKLDRYTTLAARKRARQGHQFHLFHHLLLPWDFFARAVLRLGFLDGFPGLVWAGLAAFHRWLKYAKLGEMERTPRHDA